MRRNGSKPGKVSSLLTSANAINVTLVDLHLRASAHGGKADASDGCVACRRLSKALACWLADHAADSNSEDRVED